MPSRISFPATSLVLILCAGVVLVSPLALAQEAAQSTTAVPASPRQGEGQGESQGEGQGGLSAADLGIGNPEVDQSTIADTRVGAHQGEAQGTPEARAAATAGTVDPAITAQNTETGADSTNTATVGTATTTDTAITNTSATTNAASGSAITGQNAASENTGSASVTTGTASVGVQQVTADNLVTTGSYGEIEHQVSSGPQSGDLVLEFNPSDGGAELTESFRSTNSVTGSGSDNTAEITQERETITEIQNDGAIANTLDVAAISGQNEALQNTGNAAITTGDVNVAATLLNFLNANVVDGALWLSVSDIFGDLNGNIVIPEAAVAYLERKQRELLINAGNSETGADSTNTVTVEVASTDTTTLTNAADVENTVSVEAITGQNDATQNTGGASVTTGDVDVTANTVTLANLNVVDGSLGLVIVNAFNRWVGFLLGSDGTLTPIEHDYSTLIEAGNSTTGASSDNTATVSVAETDETTVTNEATVTNALTLSAISGQNTATQNTGTVAVKTGDANVQATVVNLVNTNIIRGGFFAAIVNVFGNWFGDLIYNGSNAAALASTGGSGGGLEVTATNDTTGADSENTIEVDVDRMSMTTVENTATIENTITVDADTGNNEASRNTGLAAIDTGDVLAVLHARNLANITAVGSGNSWGEITADLVNATTGADSENTIALTVSDEREIAVSNEAAVDTAIGATANTGFNTASRNTLGGLVTTGIARLDARVENLLNEIWLLGDGAYGDSPNHAPTIASTNTQTGADSTNTISTVPTVSTDATSENAATVSTTVDASATTGDNDVSRNTGRLALGVPSSPESPSTSHTGGTSPSLAPANSGSGGSGGGGSAAGGGTVEYREEDVRPARTLAKPGALKVKGKKVGRAAKSNGAQKNPRIASGAFAVQGGGGKTAMSLIGRRLLGVKEARAAAAPPPRILPVPLLPLGDARASLVRRIASSWPWLAFLGALLLGAGSLRRGSLKSKRLTG